MPDVSSSSLRRQMREEDPRRWLEWTLAELVEELMDSVHPGAEDLAVECADMLKIVEGWPNEMHPPNKLRRMMDRVDVIRRELDEEEHVETHRRGADGTTYSITEKKAARRRSSQPHRPDPDEKLQPTTLSPVPPGSDPPRRSFTAKRSGGPRDEPPPKTRRGFGMPGVSPASPVPRAPQTTLGSRPPHAEIDDEEWGPDPDPSDSPDVERSSAPPRALALRNPRTDGAITRADVESIVERRPPRRSSLPPLGNYKIGRIIVEHLDEDAPVDDRLAMITDSRGPIAEAYRALFYRLGATSEASSIMVATSSQDEDSSVCAANLALAMALGSDDRVLVIETRFKQPRLANLFGYTPSECFGRRLAKHRRDPDAPWRVAQLGGTQLNLLALDPEQQTPPALDAQALDDVITGFVDGGFRYVVVDGPPLTEGTDAQFVARCVDGLVVAVHRGRSHQRQLRRSLDIIEGVPVLGFVMLQN